LNDLAFISTPLVLPSFLSSLPLPSLSFSPLPIPQISVFEEEDHGYLTDNASVMTDCTSDSNNNSQNGSEAGDELPEWQEFWDEQAQGKYWYNNISGQSATCWKE
jgi:hypothetical protein